MDQGITRRGFVGGSLVAPLLGAVRPRSRALASEGDEGSGYQLYWGDLHNHNAVGYAKGTLERSIEIAQEHLDFFAFTGHAWWHDLPRMPGDRHMKWVNGFKVHKEHWPKTRGLIREATSDGFAAMLGYEWHSSRFGDYCLIFGEDQPDLYLPDHVEKLHKFAAEKNALAIPHHLAYARGWRGANFDHFKTGVSPVVEIFSEHGCSESVTTPVGDFIRHSMGGRVTENTVDRQLERGLRFGFVASSDDHQGYPGGYGEGLVAVWARDLSPASIVDAVRNRRTYAVTGDRIQLDMTVNDQPMGSELAMTSDRQIDVRVEAPDSVKIIELVRSGRVIQRHFPEDLAETPAPLPGRVKCRFRYGWGPWAALDLGRVADWDIRIRLDGARFVDALPCFQTSPFDEERRDRLRVPGDNELHLVSHTSRVGSFAEDPTKALILEIDAQRADASIDVELIRPTRKRVKTPLRDLQKDNTIELTGGFTTESYMLERLVGPTQCASTIRWIDRRRNHTAADWYYVRVLQHNNQMAWSSPVWVG
ncbi:MAG: DUF3604 domain-containing protein [Planctomycetota bacterium]|jgi:hypothetical protein